MEALMSYDDSWCPLDGQWKGIYRKSPEYASSERRYAFRRNAVLISAP